MLGNERLYFAVVALVTAEGDVRTRVCLAMNIIAPLSKNEFLKTIDLWLRIDKLKKETTIKGPKIINGKILKDSFEHTALTRQNKTYKKYAKEIMEIWMETCK